MIHHVDKALESLLRQQVPLPEASVDLSFRAPEASWTASVSKPTVDVFLWDVTRAARSDKSGVDERVATNGRRQRRPPPEQVVLRYFVTVWTREQRDEHELLGAILHCVLANDTFLTSLLPDALAQTSCRLLVADNEHRLPATLWSGAPPKPGIYVEVELGVEAISWKDRGTAVEEFRIAVADKSASLSPSLAEPDERPPLRRFRSGGAVVMEGRPQPADGDGAGAGSDADVDGGPASP